VRLPARLVACLAVLEAVNVLGSFGSIALLGRMSPAIERILEENERSIGMVEEMLAVLADPEGDAARRSDRFARALGLAAANVTEQAERPLLEVLERESQAALAGEPGARRKSVKALLGLGEVNRLSMERADREARRLGRAGAWAAVLLGLGGFAAALAIAHHLQSVLVAPLVEVHATVVAARSGDRRRRCNVHGAAAEVVAIGRALDDLLDARLTAARSRVPAAWISLDRAGLLRLLDDLGEPAFVLGDGGVLHASNRQADVLFDHDGGAQVRDAALRALATAPASPGEVRELKGLEDSLYAIEATALGEQGWLCRVKPEVS
jgi:hypothetical protein